MIEINGTVMIAVMAAGAAAAAFFTVLVLRISRLKEKLEFFDFARSEMSASLDASRRVLSNENTPTQVRESILFLLDALRTDKHGRDFFSSFFADKPKRVEASDGTFVMSMEKLHGSNPMLAADAHQAIMGLMMLSIPLKYADDISVKKVLRGATDPDSVFAEVSKLRRRSDHRDADNGVGGPGGPIPAGAC